MAIFQLALLEEAKNFLQSLPDKAYKKILYNVDRVARGEKTKNSLRSWKILRYGSYALSIMGWSTACLPFGTLIHKLWW